ncbi:hypothetical protein ACHAWF_011188 [Thalassiosira exigua]
MSVVQPARLLGRSAEESILLNSYFASLSKGQRSSASIILINGDSGMGKTVLAETLRSHVVEDDGYFLQGKFDQMSYHSASRPYAGISSLFAEYCSSITQRGEEAREEVAEKLRSEIKGEEAKLLIEAIPSLRKLIGVDFAVEEKSKRRHSCDGCQHHVDVHESVGGLDGSQIYSESSGNRFIYLIKRVVSVISSVGDPIVFLVDDVQWANKTEIDALKALMKGALNPCLLIFTCRPGNHPFLKVTDEFGEKTEILLQSLNRNTVRELVASMLSINDVEDCTSLSNFISHVTNGNPFFIRQQIMALKDEGLIRPGDNGWMWDIDDIEQKELLGDVVTMLSEKMKRLTNLTQQALMVCSCIGSSVDIYILGLVLRSIGESTDYESFGADETKSNENDAIAERAISIASQEGLLAVGENGRLAFTHDSVGEAAYSLLEPGLESLYHLKLGQLLKDNICPNLFEKYLFTIAGQLSRGYELIEDEEGRIATANIFLSAGEKSMRNGGTAEAHFFFSKGMNMLREDDWTTNYRLCCDIYMKAANSASLRGDSKDLEKFLAMLFKCCRESVDSLNASYIQVRSMCTWGFSGGQQRCLEVGLQALRAAGINIPQRNLGMHVLIGLVRTRSLMRGKDAETLLLLPPVSDQKIAGMLPLLQILAHMCIVDQKPKLLLFLVFKAIELSLDHGMSHSMPNSVAMYSAILCRLGFPLEEATKYGQVALALQDEIGTDETLSFVISSTYGSAFALSSKLSDCVSPLFAGFHAGNVGSAMRCAAVISRCTFFSGKNLHKCIKVLEKLRVLLAEYNIAVGIRTNRKYRNAVDYCLGLGQSGASWLIATEDDDSKGHFYYLLSEENRFLQLVTHCIFCDEGMAWTVAEKMGLHFETIFNGSIWTYVCAFYRGMAATSMLRLTTTRKGNHQALRTAKRCVKKLRRGRKKSANLLHHSYLLEAEYAAFAKKSSRRRAEKFYQLAIEHAAQANVTHEQAYACERFGTYYFLRNCHESAYDQIREAHKLYTKWGSQPKCCQLAKKYPRLGEKIFAPITI